MRAAVRLVGGLRPVAPLLVVIPPVITFMAGWKARHTARPDLDVPPQA